jgi:hypothetical protein
MVKKLFKKKIISSVEEEAVEEAIKQIKDKFSSMQKETLFISLGVLFMMFLLPLVLPEIFAKALSGMLLWSVLIYSIYHIYTSRKDIFHFLKVRSLEKFIYQKIYDEVKKEIKSELNKKSTAENMIFNFLSDGTSLLAHKVSSKAEQMSKHIIYKNIAIIVAIVVIYNLIRNYLAYQSYHLSVVEIMFFG